jgi:hypothetical protein
MPVDFSGTISGSSLARVQPPRIFVETERKGKAAARVLGLTHPRGGFYVRLTRPRSEPRRSDEELGAKVRASFLAGDLAHGARRAVGWPMSRLGNYRERAALRHRFEPVASAA